jgi:hypothetical protein
MSLRRPRGTQLNRPTAGAIVTTGTKLNEPSHHVYANRRHYRNGDLRIGTGPEACGRRRRPVQ